MRGQSLYEMVVALGVAVLVIAAVVVVATISVRNTTFSQTESEATRRAQETLEWVRQERDGRTWDNFKSLSNRTYCMQNLSWGNTGTCSASEKISDTIFRREATLNTKTVDGVEVVEVQVRTYWDDAQGRHESNLSTRFTNWRRQ